ncbi:peptidyl-prolyl cis-trans isomerase Pin1 [Pyrus ussuriensis x Pyrus communis]|uniref:peptidylprolyl isomerase n=1 Tax=Pyrus ussuriensis x Pyrus communis TaxID=2448454 RepID=A0A5N5FUC9_9ROSA|nr:peptidyl-prolyl cis-trans isomerase Pin1 [Pyrus ussuriensis x Pyrus communis]
MSSSEENQVRASHILIKHQGSRRKASRKDPEGQIIRNTTRDSAVSQLEALRDDILSGKAKPPSRKQKFEDAVAALNSLLRDFSLDPSLPPAIQTLTAIPMQDGGAHSVKGTIVGIL